MPESCPSTASRATAPKAAGSGASAALAIASSASPGQSTKATTKFILPAPPSIPMHTSPGKVSRKARTPLKEKAKTASILATAPSPDALGPALTAAVQSISASAPAATPPAPTPANAPGTAVLTSSASAALFGVVSTAAATPGATKRIEKDEKTKDKEQKKMKGESAREKGKERQVKEEEIKAGTTPKKNIAGTKLKRGENFLDDYHDNAESAPDSAHKRAHGSHLHVSLPSPTVARILARLCDKNTRTQVPITHGPFLSEVTYHSAIVYARALKPGVVKFLLMEATSFDANPSTNSAASPDEESKHREGGGDEDNLSQLPTVTRNKGKKLGVQVLSPRDAKIVRAAKGLCKGIVAPKSTDCMAHALFRSLKPNTKYVCLVGGVPNGDLSAHSKEIRFKTAPAPHTPSKVDFVFSSCIGGQGFGRVKGEGWPIFKQLKKRNADFFLLLGDSIYADDKIPTDGGPFNKGTEMEPGCDFKCDSLESFFDKFKYSLNDPHYHAFLCSTPIWAVWDDHEVLDDWGGRKVRHSVYFESARQAFESYYPVGSMSADTKLYLTAMTRSFCYGAHAEVFILDMRSHRTRNPLKAGETPTFQTMLGDNQKRWLKNSVSASASTWKIIASSVPVAWPTGWPSPDLDGYDGWSDSGAAKEIHELLAEWKSKGVKNLVFCTGDVHFPSVLSYDPFKKGSPSFYEFGCSPLAGLPLGPSPAGPSKALEPTVIYQDGSFAGPKTNCCFGHITISETGELTHRVINAEGKEKFTFSLKPGIPV